MTIRCPHCLDDPWGVTVEGHSGECGGAGMPCVACCSPIPEDGTRSITEAFVPDWMRVPSVQPG
jgi:hypothetical protein